MKHLQKYWYWYLLGIIALIVILYLLFRPAPPAVAPPAPAPGAPAPNLADSLAQVLTGIFSSGWIKNLFGGKPEMGDPACQSSNPGFDNNGYYTRKCGGVPGGGGANCNPDNPGNDMFGFSNAQCGG